MVRVRLALSAVFLIALAAACGLNPQPEPPAAGEGATGGAAGGAPNGAGGGPNDMTDAGEFGADGADGYTSGGGGGDSGSPPTGDAGDEGTLDPACEPGEAGPCASCAHAACCRHYLSCIEDPACQAEIDCYDVCLHVGSSLEGCFGECIHSAPAGVYAGCVETACGAVCEPPPDDAGAD